MRCFHVDFNPHVDINLKLSYKASNMNIIEKNNVILERFPIGSYACNCSLLYAKDTREAIIIDPGNDFAMIKKLIEERGLKVKKLLHTHAHFDHIGQSNEVKQMTGAHICLHRDDQFLYDALPMQGKYFGQVVGRPSPIDHYLQDEEEFNLESLKLKSFLKTLHTPGHTPGSCCFYSEFFDEPLLFAGDTLFQRSIGRTDLPGGNTDQILRSIKTRLFALPEETNVVTGHGPDTNIHSEKKFNPFLC